MLGQLNCKHCYGSGVVVERKLSDLADIDILAPVDVTSLVIHSHDVERPCECTKRKSISLHYWPGTIYELAQYLNQAPDYFSLHISNEEQMNLANKAAYGMFPFGPQTWIGDLYENLIGSAYPYHWEFSRDLMQGTITITKGPNTQYAEGARRAEWQNPRDLFTPLR